MHDWPMHATTQSARWSAVGQCMADRQTQCDGQCVNVMGSTLVDQSLFNHSLRVSLSIGAHMHTSLC